jgi:hypothetical protein
MVRQVKRTVFKGVVPDPPQMILLSNSFECATQAAE